MSSYEKIVVLYKIINTACDKDDEHFNAFTMPRPGGKGPTLEAIKKHSAALHGLNHLGPEGYHWRVCVEDKPAPGDEPNTKTFSWWDVQDEHKALPVKSATPQQFQRFFTPPKQHHHSDESVSDQATKAAKGMFKSVGKAVSAAVGADDSANGPQVTVIAFKLLDLVKMHDDFSNKNHGRGGHIQQPASAPKARPAPKQQQYQEPARTPAAAASPARTQQQQRPTAPSQQQQQHRQAPAAARQQPTGNLMDFGTPASGRNLHHMHSAPSSLNHRASSNPNETRTEKLKREYQEKKQTSNRVWDPVDERWVEVDPKVANSASGSAPAKSSDKVVVGLSLDATAAIGKTAHVAAAVEKRVSDMKNSQAKALQEVREREAKKKSDEAAEDVVRQRLTPKIKAWSEEHGQKKQLRALLASLHTILWPAAAKSWKVVTIGDLLDDKKVKICYHKASRVVHPDKTHQLVAEERFLAKRIFDALSQAWTVHNDGKK
ncbi:auxilin-like clathrin-binding protein required for normal clathrin function, variant 2 [Mayamaea pseudoterrestris]|nr:auxilin-like clathrin-binding protein required for normal clathrin function, variant 2 [Mayamaea pseudoterrestris]